MYTSTLNLGQEVKEFLLWGTSCVKDPVPCFFIGVRNYLLNQSYEALKWGAYNLPNAGLRLAKESVVDLGRIIALFADQKIKVAAQVCGLQDPELYNKIAYVYRTASECFSDIEQKATYFISPIAKNALDASNAMPHPFSALHLIPPALLGSFFSKKCIENIKSAVQSTKILLSNKRTITKIFTIEHQGNKVTSYQVKQYATGELLKEIGTEAFFATVWGAGSFLTTQAMIDALVEVGNTVEGARMIATAITLMLAVTPSLISYISHPAKNSSSDSANKPAAVIFKKDEELNYEWDPIHKEYVLTSIADEMRSPTIA